MSNKGSLRSDVSKKDKEDPGGQKFRLGDVVRLNSGGPPMTISGWDNEKSNVVYCMWFTQGSHNTANTQVFDENSLMFYKKQHCEHSDF